MFNTDFGIGAITLLMGLIVFTSLTIQLWRFSRHQIDMASHWIERSCPVVIHQSTKDELLDNLIVGARNARGIKLGDGGAIKITEPKTIYYHIVKVDATFASFPKTTQEEIVRQLIDKFDMPYTRPTFEFF